MLHAVVFILTLVPGGQLVWSQSDSRPYRGIGQRPDQSADSRVALVFGNSKYTKPGLALTNPVNAPPLCANIS